MQVKVWPGSLKGIKKSGSPRTIGDTGNSMDGDEYSGY
jgi:hypothetical protein